MSEVNRRSITVKKLGNELNRAVEIKRALQENEAPDVVLSVIESETDLAEAICVVYEETLEDETLAAGIKSTIADLQARLSRVEHSIETRRGIILMAMDRAGLGTVKSPLATISIRDVPPKTVISEEDQIPARFWKPSDPTLDKRALKEALDAGETVPGASLSNGGIGLTIRVK